MTLRKDEVKYLINSLRKISVTSPSRTACLKRARKKVLVGKYKNGKDRWKFYWQCAHCLKWHADISDLEVDHIVEVGPFNGDIHDYVMRLLFPSPSNLQALCVTCHAKKTSNFNAALRYKRKKGAESTAP